MDEKTGDFRRARGVIPWQPGNEPAETTIRRLRDAPERAELAEAALADCRRVIAAIPWRALASIYTHPGVVLDADADAVGEFLDQYADEWAGGFGLRQIEEKQLERQAEDYARSLAVSVPSDNDLLSPDQEGA